MSRGICGILVVYGKIRQFILDKNGHICFIGVHGREFIHRDSQAYGISVWTGAGGGGQGGFGGGLGVLAMGGDGKETREAGGLLVSDSVSEGFAVVKVAQARLRAGMAGGGHERVGCYLRETRPEGDRMTDEERQKLEKIRRVIEELSDDDHITNDHHVVIIEEILWPLQDVLGETRTETWYGGGG